MSVRRHDSAYCTRTFTMARLGAALDRCVSCMQPAQQMLLRCQVPCTCQARCTTFVRSMSVRRHDSAYCTRTFTMARLGTALDRCVSCMQPAQQTLLRCQVPCTCQAWCTTFVRSMSVRRHDSAYCTRTFTMARLGAALDRCVSCMQPAQQMLLRCQVPCTCQARCIRVGHLVQPISKSCPFSSMPA